jgi:uncharacterized phage-associated protein
MGTMGENDVAAYLIRAIHERGDEVSNMKLQKLLYFAQGLYLAETGEPLFEAEMQAWRQGPVVPSIYRAFKKFAWHDIDEADLPRSSLPQDVIDHLEMIIDAFGGNSASLLAKQSHKTDPWLEARGPSSEDEPSDAIISKDSMKRFFSKMEDEILGARTDRVKEEEDEILPWAEARRRLHSQ